MSLWSSSVFESDIQAAHPFRDEQVDGSRNPRHRVVRYSRWSRRKLFQAVRCSIIGVELYQKLETIVPRRTLVLKTFPIQVAEGDAKEKAVAAARAAKEKVTAREQQQQLQDFEVALRKTSIYDLLLSVDFDFASLESVAGSRSSRRVSLRPMHERFSCSKNVADTLVDHSAAWRAHLQDVNRLIPEGTFLLPPLRQSTLRAW